MQALLRLLTQPQEVRRTDLAADVDADEVVVNDLEAVGYQASFSKLGAAEAAQRDPLEGVGDAQTLLGQGLVSASQARPGTVRPAPLISFR
jgi:exportin-2 (importin alpha re-exporter)